MSSGKNSLTDNRLVILLGIIASCIGIFTFFSGKGSIVELINPPTPTGPIIENTPGPVVRSSPETAKQTPTPTSTIEKKNSATPASQPVDLPSFLNYPGLKIAISDFTPSKKTTFSQIVFRVTAGDQTKKISLGKSHWEVDPVVKDISDNWQSAGNGAGYSWDYQDDGSINFNLSTHLADYEYVRIYDPGNSVTCWADNLDQYPYPIVPIYNRKTTSVDLNFALLEVGFLDNEGNAIANEYVKFGVETDGADGGEVIQNCLEISTAAIDARGIATAVLASGEYWIRLEYHGTRKTDWLEKISVSAGEYKRVIINVP